MVIQDTATTQARRRLISKALVPLDDSGLSQGILPHVSRMARGLGIRLVLLMVIDLERLHESGGRYSSEMLEAVESDTEKRLANVVSLLNAQGLQAEARVSVGQPASEIVRTALAEECGLVAMATHDQAELGRGMLGSVTDKVTHSSQVPTLTFPPECAEQHRTSGTVMLRVLVPLDGSRLAEASLAYVEELAAKLSLDVLLIRVIGPPIGSDGNPFSIDLSEVIEVDAVHYWVGLSRRSSS